MNQDPIPQPKNVVEFETIDVKDLPPALFKATETGLSKALRELPFGKALFVPRDKAVRMELMRNRVVGAVNKLKKDRKFVLMAKLKERGYDPSTAQDEVWHTQTDNVKGGFWVYREE